MSGAPHEAVILAAGRGARLGPIGADHPKGFIHIGDLPIVEESLLRLVEAGIRHVVIVTGHLAHFYERLAARYPNLISLVHNPHYATSGSMYSLSLVADEATSDFLLLESDLVYEQRALGAVLEHAAPNVLLVSAPSGVGDEVHVEASEQNLLRGMAKDRSRLGPRVIGEMVGITKVSRACFRAMLAHARPLLGQRPSLDYEDALVAAARELPVHCERLVGLVWTEIDDADQLERARMTIHPAVERIDGRAARRTSA